MCTLYIGLTLQEGHKNARNVILPFWQGCHFSYSWSPGNYNISSRSTNQSSFSCTTMTQSMEMVWIHIDPYGPTWSYKLPFAWNFAMVVTGHQCSPCWSEIKTSIYSFRALFRMISNFNHFQQVLGLHCHSRASKMSYNSNWGSFFAAAYFGF